MLSGCKTAVPPAAASSQIYAPASLVLTAGVPVPTRDGLYTPVETEVWHSTRTLSETRQQLNNALRVIENERNLPTPAR
ncbi:MAG: hypothetical protein RL077_351 [Verrucomicrobiota bacterium]|jgi:hypothetical protein